MMESVLCFLCIKNNKQKIEFYDVKSIVMPASQRPLYAVLQHLANCIKINLIFRSLTFVCDECYKELCEYDNLMLSLLESQKHLTNQLYKVLNANKNEQTTEIEDEVEFEIEDEETIINAYDSDPCDKEELIEVSNDTIETEFIDDMSTTNTNSNTYNEDLDCPPERKRCNQECLACGAVFKTKFQLQHHINDIHNTRQFVCKICGVSRKDEEYLELHMNTHEGKTENECRYCPKRFSRPVNTLRHMRIHWDKKKFQCEKCGERFSLDNVLYNHRLRHEAEENPVICSICNQSFKSRKTYNHHMLIHQENRPRHQCHLCPKSFSERYTLKMHIKTHKYSNPTSTSVENLTDNKEGKKDANNSSTDSNDKVYHCVICSTSFETKEKLELHLQVEHDVILK